MTDPSDLPPLTELPPGTFEVGRWLDAATRGLCDDARARVRADVEAHFAAAYEQRRGDGDDHDTAVRLAVASLGDPAAANRRYARVYLTEAESKRIERLARTRRVKPIVLWVSAAVFPVLTVAASWVDADPIDYWQLWTCAFIFYLAVFTTVRRRYASRPIVLVVSSWLASLTMFVMLSGWVLASAGAAGRSAKWWLVLVTAALCAECVYKLPNDIKLIAKLRGSSRGANP